MMNAMQYKGYTIRKSGKSLWKIITTEAQRPFFRRFVSADACKVAIDCREDGMRVMTAEEHKIMYPV